MFLSANSLCRPRCAADCARPTPGKIIKSSTNNNELPAKILIETKVTLFRKQISPKQTASATRAEAGDIFFETSFRLWLQHQTYRVGTTIGTGEATHINTGRKAIRKGDNRRATFNLYRLHQSSVERINCEHTV